MFQNFGPLQVLVILFVVLLLFGVGRLPQVGRGMGQAINEFKKAVGGKDSEERSAEESAERAEPKAS